FPLPSFLSLSPMRLLPHLLIPLLVAAEELNTGVYVRLNQKAVDYFASLASEAFPRLLENVTLPPIEAGSVATIEPHFEQFSKPEISAKFLSSNGVQAKVKIDNVVIKALTDINLVFYSIKEYVNIHIENVSLDVILQFGRNSSTNRNVITAERCDVVDPQITLTFKKDSELEGYADTFHNGIKDALKGAVCEKAVQALIYIDEQHVQQTEPSDEPSRGISAAELAEGLCADEKALTTLAPPGGLTSPIQTGPPWSVDLTMTLPPQFTDEDVTFGVNGGVLLASLAAKDVPQPVPIDPKLLGRKMVGAMITDFVPNTFFSHVFDFGIGEIDYKVHPEHLPSSLRSLAKLLCGGCHLQVTGSLTRKPVVEMDDKLGARVSLAANVSILFHGKKSSYDVINATTDMHLTLKPTIRRSRIYGDVALTSVDFDIKNLGMVGALAAPLEKLMSFVVPRTMWPAIRKRIRFAMHQRGIRLPVLCGVSLHDFSLSYTDRAAILQSDLAFDLELFLKKFKAHVNRKTFESSGKELYAKKR
ncbi:nrf-5, partial [Pristionchus pacificus]